MDNQKPLVPVVGIVELFLLFVLGIFGNKIAEAFDIPANSLFLFTALVLIVLSTISYTKSSRITVFGTTSWKQYLPRSMLGIFPVGILLGFLLGAIITMVFPYEDILNMPNWLTSPFTSLSVYLTTAEVLGLLVGLVICTYVAFTVNRHLAASLMLGYGIAFATSILFIYPDHEVFITYLGHLSFFILVAVAFVLFTPLIKRLGSYAKRTLTEQRV